MAKGIESVCRILIRAAALLVELGRQPLEECVDLTCAVSTQCRVEPQGTQVVTRDRPVGRQSYVGPVVVRLAEGVPAAT
jgi:hypothetical protein